MDAKYKEDANQDGKIAILISIAQRNEQHMANGGVCGIPSIPFRRQCEF